MNTINSCNFEGNLTRDIELKFAPSGTAIANAAIAINERKKDSSGEWVDDPVFIDFTAFGKTAESMAKNFAKGDKIYINGRMRMDRWEDKNGGKRSRLYVVVNEAKGQFYGKDRQQARPEQGGGQAGPETVPF